MLTNQAELNPSLQNPWQICLKKIQEKISSATFETWFRTTDLLINSDGHAFIRVPNQFFADFMEQNFSELIKNVLKECSITFNSLAFTPFQKDWKVINSLTESFHEIKAPHNPNFSIKKQVFHPNYVFDNFIVGDCNRMAHSAALAIAEAPGKTSFNPFVIYGGTGLGKTHLLQAIGNYAQTEETAKCVVYMNSEEFTTQYITYVVEKKDSTSFYKKFNDVDLLLIDDIHFFSGKVGTQKEFYRIFNRLLLEKKQIVLSSDRAPDQIPDMMEHIISRFMGGLIADIQPPNLETRIAILKKKAETDGLNLPEEVIQFIASNITSNVRELEGVLIKLIASSSFTGKDITLEIAKELCRDIISRREQRINIKFIQQKVAEIFNISPNQLRAHTRKQDSVIPRSVAMFLCKKWTKQSLRTIGLEFGGRDYSTVIHACKKIETELLQNNELKEKIEKIEELIKQAC
jgi:chromosomal replication initiator protein